MSTTTTVSFPGLGLSFDMNRVAFTIFGVQVYWYAILIVGGLLLAYWYATRKSKYFGIDNDDLLDVLIIAGIAGVIGSRIYYVVFASPGEFTSFWQIFDLRRGGLAFYGAVIFAVVAAWFVCRKKKMNFWAMADLGGIGFLIGQAVGRWGNFVNQEAFGTNTSLPWGMTSSVVQNYLIYNYNDLVEKGMVVDPTMPVHPTFLYESLWCALGILLFTLYIKRRKFDGEMFLMYLAWNGLGRFFIEALRTDSLYLIGTLRVSQFLAALMVVVSVSTIVYIRSRIKRSGDPDYLKPFGMTEAGQQFLKDKAETRAQQAELAKQRREARRSGAPMPEAEEKPKKQAKAIAEPINEADEKPTPKSTSSAKKATNSGAEKAKTAAKSSAAKSGAAKPASAKAGAAKSTTAKTATAKSSAKTTSAKSSASKTSGAKTAAKPAAKKPTAPKSAAGAKKPASSTAKKPEKTADFE